MQIGDKVKDFTLTGISPDGEVKEYSLSEFSGENVVIYFYPKDNTPGCTNEACDFRDNIGKLSCKASILGISSDSIESHKDFQDKHNLNFVLLSDPSYTVLKQFESFDDKKLQDALSKHLTRSTYLIDKTGHLRHIWRNVKVDGHVNEVVKILDAMCPDKYSMHNNPDTDPHRDKHPR